MFPSRCASQSSFAIPLITTATTTARTDTISSAAATVSLLILYLHRERRWTYRSSCADMPAAVKDGEFTECDGDLQDEVGVYTTNGQGELFPSVSRFLR